MRCCGEMLDFDEWWFVCQLDTGHDGDHEARNADDEPRTYVIRWPQAPATVVGEVVPPPDADMGLDVVWDDRTCQHETTAPVHAAGRLVARICTACHAQLEPGWGCGDCEWTTHEDRRLCEVRPTVHHVLIRPCKEHT